MSFWECLPFERVSGISGSEITQNSKVCSKERATPENVCQNFFLDYKNGNIHFGPFMYRYN